MYDFPEKLVSGCDEAVELIDSTSHIFYNGLDPIIKEDEIAIHHIIRGLFSEEEYNQFNETDFDIIPKHYTSNVYIVCNTCGIQKIMPFYSYIYCPLTTCTCGSRFLEATWIKSFASFSSNSLNNVLLFKRIQHHY